MSARRSLIPGFSLAAGLLALSVSAHADTFGSGADTFTIDFVTIGNPGNGDDRALDVFNHTPGNPNDDEYASPYGGVAYTFRMGAYEISQDTITKATSLGMTNVVAGSWTGSQPAAEMTWYEAAAFVNWLNTSAGHQAAYDLTWTGSDWTMNLWTSGNAWQLGGQNLYRHKDAYYFLPSEDEWYKAAYHKNDGVTANYWDYPTASNNIPTAVASGTTPGTAVYYDGGSAVAPAAVDNNGGLSAYGTRGQGGNVLEWSESAIDGLNNSASEIRAVRGGDSGLPEENLRASYRRENAPENSNFGMGFRVASVPEPGSAALLAAAAFPLLLRRPDQLGANTDGLNHSFTTR